MNPFLKLLVRTGSSVATKTFASHVATAFTTPRKREIRDWEKDVEARMTRERFGDGLSALVSGEGPTIYAIHGWEARATFMAALASAWEGQGFRTVLIDAPAHGESKGSTSSPFQFADAIASARQHWGPAYAVVGHSMGGGAALLDAATNGDVSRVISIAGPTNLPQLLSAFANYVGLSASARTEFVCRLEKQTGHDVNEFQLTKRIEQLADVHGLLIHSTDDQEVPIQMATTLAEVWSASELVTFDSLGHRKILRAEPVVEYVGAWLKRNSKSNEFGPNV